MSDKILRANYSGTLDGVVPATFQAAWRYKPFACYRPAADFGIPIACIVYSNLGNPQKNFTTFDTQNYREYDTYASCCPSGMNNTPQIYMAWRQCPAAMCYTHDESVAKDFDACVKRKAEERSMRGYQVPMGRCEYVDYGMLKKGIRGGASGRGHKGWTLQSLLTLAVGCVFIAGVVF